MPHPLDLNYELLKADLSVVDRSSEEYKVIERNLRSTSYSNLHIIDVWRVDRNGVVRDETVCCIYGVGLGRHVSAPFFIL